MNKTRSRKLSLKKETLAHVIGGYELAQTAVGCTLFCTANSCNVCTVGCPVPGPGGTLYCNSGKNSYRPGDCTNDGCIR